MIKATNKHLLPAVTMGMAALFGAASDNAVAQDYYYPPPSNNVVQLHSVVPQRPAEKPVVLMEEAKVRGFLRRLIDRVRPNHRFRQHSFLTENDARHNLYQVKQLQPKITGELTTKTAQVQTSLGFVKVKSANAYLAMPQSFSKLYGADGQDLAKQSWTKFTNLFVNEFYSLKFDSNNLSKNIVQAIEPYLKLDSSWGYHPEEVFFAYTAGIKPEELGTVNDLSLRYGLDEKKGSIDHNKTALDYAINRVTKQDIKEGEGHELLVLEAANKRKFLSYLKEHAPSLNPKEVFAFAQKHLGVKPISDYEKDIIKDAHDYCPIGNLYRVNGKFLARAVLNTLKLKQIGRIEDSKQREAELAEFYGNAKKHVFMLSGEDHNAVSKPGMGLERFAELDELGKEKIFVMIPNDEIDYEGEAQRPDESILSAMEILFDCINKPADIFTGFGHGSRFGVCVAPNSSASQVNNPNYLDLGDGLLMQAKSCLLAPDAVVNWISCSTAKPYTQEEYAAELQSLKPFQQNISQYQKELKSMRQVNTKYEAELVKLAKELNSSYAEKRSAEITTYILKNQKRMLVVEKSLQFEEESLKQKSEFIGRIFAHEYTAAINLGFDDSTGRSLINRKVNAAVVDVKNLPAGPGGYGGTGQNSVSIRSN